MTRLKPLALFVPLILALAIAGCGGKGRSEAQIKDFIVMDIPYDSGSGLMLKWRPLDKDQRIIQYNIYRGHTPDSLFLLGSVEVDPKTGFAGDWMSFTDKDYLPLIEFEKAPGKLTPEKSLTTTYSEKQASGKEVTRTARLFKSVPRDPDLLGSMLEHYTVLGEIPSTKFFNASKRIVTKDQQGEDEVYAGYRLTQFNNIYANPLSGNPYYYCVVPVSETGHMLPPTPVRSAVPLRNRPDSTAVLNTAYLSDTRELRFEWNPPLGSAGNITSWEVWLLPKSSLPTYQADARQNLLYDRQGLYQEFSAAWKTDAVKVHEMSPSYWSSDFYDKVSIAGHLDSLKLREPLSDYQPLLVCVDGSDDPVYTAVSMGEPLTTHVSAELPKLPAYKVVDKANDKGDNLIISFGRPSAFVSQATFLNRDRTRLRVNYEISENGHQRIDKLRFEFFNANGEPLGSLIEQYPDKIINFRPKSGFEPEKPFRVRISVRLVGEKDFAKEYLEQEVLYEPASYRYGGGEARVGNQVLNSIYYDIFSANRLSGPVSPGMRIGALSRSYDHTIPYPSVQTPMLAKYDPKTKLLLTDHHFLVAVDSNLGLPFYASLYREETVKELLEMHKERGDLSELEFITKLPAFQEALYSPNDRAWRKVLLGEEDINSRSYTYAMLATNGKGLWSDEGGFPSVSTAKDGKPVFTYPRGEWFDLTKLATLIATFVMGIMVVYALIVTRRKDVYIRPIAGLAELDNAVGRATEMGRPVMFVPGWGTLGEPCTISALMILNQIAKKTAEYDIRLISPHVDYFVVPLAQEMVQSAYSEIGRPDAYNQNDIFFVSDTQFAFCAAVNGITVRDRVATIFYMGYFYAEALLMTETGNQSGAIQIAASDAITQIPFFITTCDYTLIGEEFYAASAYLSRNLELLSMLKAQDYFKILIVILVLIGTVISTLNTNIMINFLPIE